MTERACSSGTKTQDNQHDAAWPQEQKVSESLKYIYEDEAKMRAEADQKIPALIKHDYSAGAFIRLISST